MTLSPLFRSKRSILIWIAIISAVLTTLFFLKFQQLDNHYSILPQSGKTPSYAKETALWTSNRQHPDGFFVNNPDLFNEPSVLNKETIRLSRYAVEALAQLKSLDSINREALISFVMQNYQAPSNAIGNLKGFSALPNSEVNIRSTMDSIIILRELDALERIDAEAISQLILAYQNDDGGFWDPGYPEFAQHSTIKASSFAIRTLHFLGHLNNDTFSVAKQQRLNQFVKNSWAIQTKAHAPFPGHPAISSYDAFRAWVTVYCLPINHQDKQIVGDLIHLEELVQTLNTTFRTTDNVYSETGETNRNSLKASHLTVWMLTQMEQTDKLPKSDIIRYIKSYQDPEGGFSGDIYSVYSAVDTLRILAPTRMSRKLLTYQSLTYLAALVSLVSLLVFLTLRRRVLRKKQSVLVHKVQTDRLTGIHNREFLEQRYLRYKTGMSPISLVLIDVDYFKHINDTYGHLVGDDVLIEVAKILNDNIRKTDTLARWGGEEFAILCPETNSDAAKIFSEKLRSVIQQHQFPNIPSLTCSFGVTCSMKSNEPLKELFARADKALYQSKNEGRDRVTYL